MAVCGLSLAGEAHAAAWCPFLRGFGFVLLDALEGLQVELGLGDTGLCSLAALAASDPSGSGHTLPLSKYDRGMEIIGLVIAGLAVLVAAVSARYAQLANRRAAEANKTAQQALDLQARIDAREREFHQVTWEGQYALAGDDEVVFELTNVGLSPAHDVTVVITPNGMERETLEFDLIAPGQSAQSRMRHGWEGRTVLEMMLLQDDPFEVHWSSPLGKAQTYKYAGRQAF